MLNQMFRGIFDTDMTNVIAVQDFLLCVGCSLVIGLILAVAYMCGTRYTAGDCLCCHHDGKWKCRNWGSGRRGI